MEIIMLLSSTSLFSFLFLCRSPILFYSPPFNTDRLSSLLNGEILE